MSRALIVLNSEVDRLRALNLLERVPLKTRVHFKESKRSLAQNDHMWLLLTDVSRQAVHIDGCRYTPDEWKLIFLGALDREMRTIPGLDGEGVVALGGSSSDLSKSEMANLIELILAWGARKGVRFYNEKEDAA